MLGYISKDTGLAHYQLRTHQLTNQEMSTGKQDRDALVTAYDEGKEILTVKNIVAKAYQFIRRSLYPAIPPFLQTVTYMLQTGQYMLSSDFVSVYRKMDLDEAEALWSIIWRPKEATKDATFKILFDPRYTSKKGQDRYFLGGVRTIEPDTASSISPIAINNNNLATTLVDHMRNSQKRSRSSTERSPNYPTEDFTALPSAHSGNDDITYEIDETGDSSIVTELNVSTYVVERICPDHVDEMLTQVQQLRLQREKLFQGFRYTSNTNVNPSSLQSSSSSHQLSTYNNRSASSNYDDIYDV
mmetsp:Transcript_9309/g.13931  ORF Transcript_9309/g.13931 Transcript_9309/m.13931 type:complete len:300 (+) Transcript_9309:72-971(+)